MGSGPTTRDRRDADRTTPLRAVVAVLALYAVLLQAFLGGLMPAAAAADGLCVHHASADPAPEKAPPHDHGDCCRAARATGPALAPRDAPTALAWRAVENAPVGFEPPAEHRTRPPPDGGASPRGPPTA